MDLGNPDSFVAALCAGVAGSSAVIAVVSAARWLSTGDVDLLDSATLIARGDGADVSPSRVSARRMADLVLGPALMFGAVVGYASEDCDQGRRIA